jgi:formylglycine-generating enzyme required for sulfatase activity
MVLIPAGTYTIGSNTGPTPSRPAHSVALGAFGIDAHEVTVGEYEPFVQTGRTPAPWGDSARPDGNLPVTGVTWGEAASYCAWRHPDGGRLPREEEWEAAARGADGRMYPWGDTWDPNAANTGSRRKGPTIVGSYPRGRSPSGLEDLIGNVWEWTSSPYKSSYADTTRSSGGLYVIRGAGYNSYDNIATAVTRSAAQSAAARSSLEATGFRCAMPARTSSRP